jgi:hypothetical protein
MREIDYTDQAGSLTLIEDRQITSAYTPYGIKQIESNFITRIRNINSKIKEIYSIDRVRDTFIGRDGKVHDSLRYVDEFNVVDYNDWLKKRRITNVRVVWDDGNGCEDYYDFKNGDERPFPDKKTMFENPKTLIKDIKKNPHLHSDIKKNLLLNLKNILDENK